MKKRILLSLCVLCILCSCKNNDNNHYMNQSSEEKIIDTEGMCQIDEFMIPDANALLDEYGKYDRTSVIAEFLQDEKMCRFVELMDEAGYTVAVIYQELNDPYQKWDNYQLHFDEERFYLDNVFESVNQEIYLLVSLIDQEGLYLAKMTDCQLEVVSEFPEEYLDWNFDVLPNGQYLLSDSITNTIFVVNEFFDVVKEIKVTGFLLGCVWDEESQALQYLSVSKQKLQLMDEDNQIIGIYEDELLSVTGYVVSAKKNDKILVADENCIYSVKDDKNQVQKNLETVCLFYKNDYILKDLEQIDFTVDGNLIALATMEDGEYILKVKDELSEVIEKQEIIISCENRDMILENMIAKFNRSSDYYRITMRCMDDITETESFCTELQLQLAKGEGPDIIVSNVVHEPENWVRLGYCDKLDDIIDNPEDYLSSALLSGQVDGVQYGIPFDFNLKMVVYPESFGENNLTFEALIEKMRKENVEVLECDLSGCDIILQYCLQDMENKNYIDWENGISHLNEEAFLEALKFAKEYQDNSEYYPEKVSDYLKEGKAIAVSQEIDELQDYCFFESCFRGYTYWGGYPTIHGGKACVQPRLLYMNAFSQNKEGVKEFLKYVVSEETQNKNAAFEEPENGFFGRRPQWPVLLDAINDKIDQQREIRYEVAHDCSGVAYRERDLNDEEVGIVKNIIMNAMPENEKVNLISDIIYEELEPYFYGDASVESVAEKLHSRVQIFLNERDVGDEK